MADLSILIPSRNEMFLSRTIDDILGNIEGDTEVIAVCDGNWPDPPVHDHPRVSLVYHTESIGQRAATNEAARLSRAKYIMKVDAHCAFDKGFDRILMEEAPYLWTVVPRMYNLHAFDWVCSSCGHRTYQGPTPVKCEVVDKDGNVVAGCGATEGIAREMVWKPRISRRSDFYRFDKNLHFQYWGSREKEPENKGKDIVETMSLLGACWMMHRERYWELDGMDEAHGSWGQMGTEVACKTWLSGGRLVTNRRTWFAHMFRTQGGDFGFPYPNPSSAIGKARERSRQLWIGNEWPKAKHPLSWLIKKFNPPGWKEPTKGLVYYTDNNPEPDILIACQKQILKCMEEWKYPIFSVSQKPIDFGKNFVMDIGRSLLSMYRQILRGVTECQTDIIFLVEHDLLYHPSHFDYTPVREDTFYYDRNRWNVDMEGKAVFYHNNCPSRLVAYRSLLIDYYKRVVDFVQSEGFKHNLGFSPPKGLPKELQVGRYEAYMAKEPCIDIRHERTFTRARMTKEEFRNERGRRGWTEADEVPGWGRTKGRMQEIIAQYATM
jgi:Glycosyl transferase family 2